MCNIAVCGLGLTVFQSSLGGENGEIYVFQWLGANERALQQTTAVRQSRCNIKSDVYFVQADLKNVQQPLLDTLLKLVTALEPYPAPGRPVRSLVAQCLVLIYTYGDTKTLYDSIQTLLKPLDSKSTYKDAHKV